MSLFNAMNHLKVSLVFHGITCSAEDLPKVSGIAHDNLLALSRWLCRIAESRMPSKEGQASKPEENMSWISHLEVVRTRSHSTQSVVFWCEVASFVETSLFCSVGHPNDGCLPIRACERGS